MTQGSPVFDTVIFALPLIAGNLFQQLYSLTDAAVVGNHVGVAGFAAISCTGWIIWLINATSRDISNAFCIEGSKCIGKKDYYGFKRILAFGFIFSAIVVCLLLFLIILGIDVILSVLNVPADIYEQAKSYLLLISLAIPLNVTFHFIAGMLRAAGNSVITFYTMLTSTVINILLDLLFVIVLHRGVIGAAIATIVAQACSMVLVLFVSRKSELFKLSKSDWIPNKGLLQTILKLWIPMALNSIILSLGGMYATSKINAMGTYFAAGTETSAVIFNVLEAIIMAVQTGANVFIGQNYGAGYAERIQKGMRQILIVATSLTFALICVVWLTVDDLVKLFMSASDPILFEKAFTIGVQSTKTFITCMLIMTPMYFYRSALQVIGHPEFSVYGAVLQVIGRVFTVTVLPAYLGVYAYYIPTAVAWLFTLPVVAIPYHHYINALVASNK